MKMTDRVESMALDICLTICDGASNPGEVRAMLNNLEEAIKNYVQYDSILSDIRSLNICRTNPRMWEVGAVIDCSKPKECVPGS